MTDPAFNPSLQKKSAARVAAVQCLYTESVTGDIATPQKRVSALKKRLTGNRDEQKLVVGQPLEPDYKLVESILSGILERKAEIDTKLQSALNDAWKRDRMSPVLVAILQCGIFELRYGKKMSSHIVIDEYTRLARNFFADAEADFVHAALSRLAQDIDE